MPDKKRRRNVTARPGQVQLMCSAAEILHSQITLHQPVACTHAAPPPHPPLASTHAPPTPPSPPLTPRPPPPCLHSRFLPPLLLGCAHFVVAGVGPLACWGLPRGLLLLRRRRRPLEHTGKRVICRVFLLVAILNIQSFKHTQEPSWMLRKHLQGCRRNTRGVFSILGGLQIMYPML